MAQQTAVEWLLENLPKSFKIKLTEEGIKEYLQIREQANLIFEQQIKDAVIYGLDEDGHTGDWKISVAQKYYNEKHLEIKGLSD